MRHVLQKLVKCVLLLALAYLALSVFWTEATYYGAYVTAMSSWLEQHPQCINGWIQVGFILLSMGTLLTLWACLRPPKGFWRCAMLLFWGVCVVVMGLEVFDFSLRYFLYHSICGAGFNYTQKLTQDTLLFFLSCLGLGLTYYPKGRQIGLRLGYWLLFVALHTLAVYSCMF